MARDFKVKGEIIGSIVISINHKGRVASVEIKGQGDLCTRQTLKSAMSLVDIAIMHARSKRKKSGLDKMKDDRIKENKLAKQIKETKIEKDLEDARKEKSVLRLLEEKKLKEKTPSKFITKKEVK